MTLILPSALPLPLLSTILDTLFTNFQAPTISLLSSPALSTAAAGLRSGLVVDVGWRETVVTSVYEYREVQTLRSTRATKLLGEEILMMLSRLINPELSQMKNPDARAAARELLSFEECEEVVTRMAWCGPGQNKSPPEEHTDGLASVKEEDEFRSSMRSLKIWGGTETEPQVSIPLKSCSPPRTLEVAFSNLSDPCEDALFAKGVPESELDDEEMPLHLLIYRSLLKLPTDVRSICMARIILVGGGSKLPGLKSRVLNELSTLVQQRGWNNVQGKAVEAYRNNPKLNKARSRNFDDGPIPVTAGQEVPAYLQPHDEDPIEEALRRESRKRNPPMEEGSLRAIDSLGAWSGGSLLSHLKVPAVSVIDKDQWLQHGSLGASRGGEISVSSRQSMGPGAFKTAGGGGDRSSWTLGLWA
ncbi:Actin-like ATPase [Glarea lozoyensis ATCC 20868]|uniref:Actin-like ATPase n=1 Tax=Glarea lozoyensis (strain ATCC 20868 / MF5171) TaxID=1116229 RepID=S3D451_GLAL2|nr:Actin-like ATPase [Glarea lozoyensis ATCC 20868]EPE32595.1 Actin-like ATPase [Glarea lozoyensis ATCC 20868]